MKKPEKRATLGKASAFFLAGLLSLPLPVRAETAPLTTRRLGDCNWQVTYRGHVYDLSPLTREALARPIENDIRFALQRVPEAKARLDIMSGKLREARGHTIIASVFLSGFLLARLLQSGVKTPDQRREFDLISAAAGGMFLGATIFSWGASQSAKEELVRAVDAFNEHSPHKIEPAMPSELRN